MHSTVTKLKIGRLLGVNQLKNEKHESFKHKSIYPKFKRIKNEHLEQQKTLQIK